MNKVYKLNQYQMLEAVTLAKAASLKYRFNSKSPYGSNSVKMHEVGKIGEIGLLGWLESEFNDLTIVPAFKDNDLEADIIIKSNKPDVKDLRIEIKSSRNVVWNQLHATVSAKQLSNIRKKSDIIVYCAVHTVKGLIHVEGFNYTDDEHEDLVNCEIMVKRTKTGVDVKSFVLNERPLHELYDLIKTKL